MLSDKPTLSQEEIYEKYKNLIHFAIKRYQNICSSRFDYEDLFQVAYIALSHAYENWDPKKGSFTTIALIYINQQIRRYILKNISPFSHSGRDYINLDDMKIVYLDSEENDAQINYYDVIGLCDSQPKIDEIIEIASKEAISEKQFIYWYRRYILNERVTEISSEENISRARIHKLISDLNNKIKKVYFETE